MVGFFTSGCGMVIGTIVDSALNTVTYPFKEHVFAKAYKYDNVWTEKYIPIEEKDEDYGEVLLGLAVSGGGSRSAYFFSCIVEELSKIPISPGSSKTYLDEVDFISSVSGGSLASTYYCMKRYHPKYKDEDFFPKFKINMKRNFEKAALVRYTVGGNWTTDFFTYYDRGDLMASIWDKMIFKGATFNELIEAQNAGSPKLIINGTILNNGLKFVFSTIPDQKFNNSQYFSAIRDSSFIQHSATQSYVPFQTVGFEYIDSDIKQYRLSKAIVASAAVPSLLGPVTLKDRSKEKDRFLHIVDGGVYDNYGVESLMQVFTEYLDRNPGKKSLILVIDGSGYFKEDERDSDDFNVSYYAERPISISWLRTKGYMEFVFQQARNFKNKNNVVPYQNLSFNLLSLYGVLPSQEEKSSTTLGISDPNLKKILNPKTFLRPDVLTEDFIDKLVGIRTGFALSKSDAVVIEKVAAQVVKSKLYSEKKPD